MWPTKSLTFSREPKGCHEEMLDIFAGASCIYSLLGAREYSWRFIASDIDELALQHAGELVAENDLKQQIVLSHLA